LHSTVAPAYGTIRTKPNQLRRGLLETAAKSHRSYPVGNNKNPNQEQPGEKEPGTLHYNPGNMSGKTAGTKKDEPQSTADKNHGDPDPQDK